MIAVDIQKGKLAQLQFEYPGERDLFKISAF